MQEWHLLDRLTNNFGVFLAFLCCLYGILWRLTFFVLFINVLRASQYCSKDKSLSDNHPCNMILANFAFYQCTFALFANSMQEWHLSDKLTNNSFYLHCVACAPNMPQWRWSLHEVSSHSWNISHYVCSRHLNEIREHLFKQKHISFNDVFQILTPPKTTFLKTIFQVNDLTSQYSRAVCNQNW